MMTKQNNNINKRRGLIHQTHVDGRVPFTIEGMMNHAPTVLLFLLISFATPAHADWYQGDYGFHIGEGQVWQQRDYGSIFQ